MEGPSLQTRQEDKANSNYEKQVVAATRAAGMAEAKNQVNDVGLKVVESLPPPEPSDVEIA